MPLTSGDNCTHVHKLIQGHTHKHGITNNNKKNVETAELAQWLRVPTFCSRRSLECGCQHPFQDLGLQFQWEPTPLASTDICTDMHPQLKMRIRVFKQ